MVDNTINEPAWPTFQRSMLDEEVGEKTLPEPIITNVLSDFGIPVAGDLDFADEDPAGRLDNIDLKRVDPISTIKASLLERFAMGSSDHLQEFAVNEDGEVYIYDVGGVSGNYDYYYHLLFERIKDLSARLLICL